MHAVTVTELVFTKASINTCIIGKRSTQYTCIHMYLSIKVVLKLFVLGV